MHQTEVQKIWEQLQHGKVSGAALAGKFRSAARADSKLACALLGYFSEGDDSYLPYLRSRIRPAATELVLAGKVRELEALDAVCPLSRTLTEELLETAINARVPDSIIWLLKYKQQHFGFAGRELTL